MLQWARLLLLSLLIYLSPIASGAPSFPKLQDIAQSFESSAEITDLLQNTSGLAKEYYDFSDKSGRLDFMAFGLKLTYFFNGSSDQVYEVNDTACIEKDGGVAELDMSFFGWTRFDPPFVGPSALIMMKEKDPPEYVEDIYVREIKCSWFRSDTYKNGANLTLNYYFSVPEWDMPYYPGQNKKPFPIRITVTHVAESDLQDYIVDFIYFRPRDIDKSKFQPPVGLGCWMKEPKIKLPTIPQQYTFSIEEFDLLRETKHGGGDINTATIWYDYYSKYARIDKYTSMGKISDLSDFKTGVMYHMHDDRTCVFKTMRKSYFLKFEPDSNVGKMKDPYEVLNLQGDDDTFYTMGQAEVRGVKCNVYEKVDRDTLFQDVRYKMVVTTVYLSTDSTKIQVDGEDLDFSPPLQTIITAYSEPNKVAFKKQYQIFSFNDEPGSRFFWTYPSDECFPKSNQKSYFVIMIDTPTSLAAGAESEDDEFLTFARNRIIETANITEFRLPFLRPDFRASGIYITGLMLDMPPILSQFWKEFDEPVPTDTISAYKIDLDSATEEACAAACLAYPEPCKGFHFCGKGCFINLGEITDKPVDNIPLGLDCYIYIRAVSDSRNDQDSLEQALKNLATATEKKTLEFSVRIKGDEYVLPATAVVYSFNNRGGDDVSSYPYTLVKAGFQFKGDSFTTLEVPDALSEEDCYSYCKDSTSISCASFSYCAQASNKMCRISSVLLGGDSSDYDKIDANVKCDIFSLLFLDLYDLYPGKVVTIPGQKTADEAYNAESCAKACKEEKGFRCRGFEYCKSKNTCVLHSKHVLDLKGGETLPSKTDCLHYAAKFVADYRDMGLQKIDDDSNKRIDTTLEQCARACSEEMPSCNSFVYCAPTEAGMTDSSCAMTPKTFVSAVPDTNKKCHLFTKREYIEDWKPRPRKADTGGYTKGSFAGLLIGMIILGAVVGVLLFVGYSVYRSRRGGGDGLTVKFSKQEDT